MVRIESVPTKLLLQSERACKNGVKADSRAFVPCPSCLLYKLSGSPVLETSSRIEGKDDSGTGPAVTDGKTDVSVEPEIPDP